MRFLDLQSDLLVTVLHGSVKIRDNVIIVGIEPLICLDSFLRSNALWYFSLIPILHYKSIRIYHECEGGIEKSVHEKWIICLAHQ